MPLIGLPGMWFYDHVLTTSHLDLLWVSGVAISGRPRIAPLPCECEGCFEGSDQTARWTGIPDEFR